MPSLLLASTLLVFAYMRPFFTYANISILLCALSMPIAAVLARIVHALSQPVPQATVLQDSYAFLGMSNTTMTTVLFFAVFMLCIAGMVCSIISLRKSTWHQRAVVGGLGNTLVLLFTFLWILFQAFK